MHTLNLYIVVIHVLYTFSCRRNCSTTGTLTCSILGGGHSGLRLEILLPHQKEHKLATPAGLLRQRRSSNMQGETAQPLFEHGHARNPPWSNWLISANVFTAYYYQSVNLEAFTDFIHMRRNAGYFLYMRLTVTSGWMFGIFGQPLPHSLITLFLKWCSGVQWPWRPSCNVFCSI